MAFADIAVRLREAGREINYPNMALSQQAFADQHETEPYADVAVTRDVAYGRDGRHRLDLFVQQPAAGPLPIVLFVHGGGFVRGDKRVPGTPYSDNVGLFAVRNGLIGVTMTHRLAPDHQWPAGAEDVAAAVHWLVTHAAEFGGDPARVFLLGTSAGATHAAGAIALDGGVPVAGAILLSGMYDFADPALAEVLAPYLGDDHAAFAEKSPLDRLVASNVPIMPVMAELDPPEFERQTFALVTRLFERDGRMPPFVRLPGHSHFSAALHLNGDDRWLGERIVDFIEHA
jgi:triacylglycerol lipase